MLREFDYSPHDTTRKMKIDDAVLYSAQLPCKGEADTIGAISKHE